MKGLKKGSNIFFIFSSEKLTR